MAINPARLTQSDLLQVINATPLGVVLSRPRLRRQMDAGALRFGDGTHIHLVRYVRWLIDELDRPRPQRIDYAEARRRQAERNRAATKASQDIFPIPEIEDCERRKRCGESFRLFCETYFPAAFHREWSSDHLRVIAKIEKAVREGGLFAFAMPRGSGKALALDTPLPTPSGWTTMGEVQVGDRLFDENGLSCLVVFATEIQVGRPCYRVAFSDGEVIVCDSDHLWTVFDRYSRSNPITLPTQTMAARVLLKDSRGHRSRRYRIPLAAPLQTPPRRLPIAPYALGVWLGDGACANAKVTLNLDDAPEIESQITEAGETLSWCSWENSGHCRDGVLTKTKSPQTSFQARLRRLGLLDNKHIPDVYLRASYSQRLDLLQGLMDTDGYIDEEGHCEITLKQPRLVDGLCEILTSLGVKYGRSEKWVRLNGSLYGPYARIIFDTHEDLPVFRLERKRRRIRPIPRTQPLSSSRQIVAIEPAPSVPVRCIQVNSPSGLYLAGRRMIPTHNTTLARCSALWAVLYGYRPFVCLIGAADDRAKELLLPIKKHIVENPLLLADFPESVYPLRCLENSSKRQLQQHIQGQLTHVHWGQEKLVFPTIEGDHLPHALRTEGYEVSPSCGSIITTTSLDANMRGQQHTRADGSIIRPSLVLLDDPQTRQSAASPTQTRRRLELLNGDVLGMAGPGEQISAVLTCTKIYDNDLADQVLDKEKNPEWDSECTKLVYAFPTNEKLWDEYKHIRDTQGHKAATEFYGRHREQMDAGASVAWPARYDRKSELSAVQHAMNLKFKVGPEAFASEYQNEPVLEQTNDQVLTVEQVLAKTNGYKRGDVPAACTKLTMFIDLHDRLLFYCVCAWEENFTGYVIDYGTFPQQRRYNFTLATAPATLGRAFPGMGTDGAIHAGLEKLVSTYLAREWKRGETLMRIDRLLVDMGYKPGIVADVKRKVGGAAVMASKGIGIRASRKPLASYMRHPGEVHGHFWYVPNVRKTGEFPHVLVDVNYWKTFVHAGLATAAGDRGCISLFGKDGREHDMFAEHVAHSETWVEVQGMGRIVHEWSPRPTRPDNHWFDCLVGCAAAASMCGVKAAGEGTAARPRKRYTQDDLRRTG